MDPLPDRVRLVSAPGELRGRELEVLGCQYRDAVTWVICRMVDGAPGAVPACWTDLPECEPGEPVAVAMAVNTSKKAVAELMRVAWRTVGSICKRVADEATADKRPVHRPEAGRDR